MLIVSDTERFNTDIIPTRTLAFAANFELAFDRSVNRKRFVKTYNKDNNVVSFKYTGCL